MTNIRFYILLIITSLALVSCASNSDDDPTPPGPGPDPGTPVDLTVENLIGTWQIGYFQQKVGNASALRLVQTDGFEVQFFANKTYIERNSLGEETLTNGSFGIINKDSIQLSYRPIKTGKDTSVVINISKITDKVVIREQSYEVTYENIKRNVTDIQYMRHMDRAPNETFGLTKGDKMTIGFLAGTWNLEVSKQYIGGQPNNSYPGNEYKDTKMTLNTDYTFKQVDPKGLITEGQIVLIDDVIHFYYVGKNTEGDEEETLTTMQTNKLPAFGDNYFEHYQKSIDYRTTSNTVYELFTIYKKIPK